MTMTTLLKLIIIINAGLIIIINAGSPFYFKTAN